MCVCIASFGTLFRVNSMASKIMTFWSRQSEGTEYISQVLGKEISQICACKYGSLEINPEHARPEDDIGANVATLTRIEQGVVDSIVGSVDLCPLQFRVVCSYLYRYCSAKFPDQALRAVGGFIILRFFSAAIVAPEANGLAEEAPPLDARRILVLISKTIQNLSNHTLFRESFMEKSFNTFLADNQARVDGFLRAVAQVPAFAEGMSSEELCSQAAVAAVAATTAVAASGGGSSASAVSSSLTSSDPSSSSSSAVVISQIGKEEFEDALGNLAQLCVKNAIAIENALVGPDAVKPNN